MRSNTSTLRYKGGEAGPVSSNSMVHGVSGTENTRWSTFDPYYLILAANRITALALLRLPRLRARLRQALVRSYERVQVPGAMRI